MKRLRFIMLGGFLGAGKTTTLARLAHHCTARGQRVGIVTNDQADNLVDTTSLRAQGFAVQEVAGACFCCRFDDLVGRVGQLQSSDRPDVILAEPVGSCTDLAATVAQPLMDLYGERFQVAPYAVLFKPSHGFKILKGGGAGFSPKAAYIFHKQLEEADAIVINRIDELAPPQVDELQRLVEHSFPGTPILRLSAKTGQGFDSLVSLLDTDGNFGRKVLDIDYDTYAAGEAELGWLNASLTVEAERDLDLDELLLAVVAGLGTELVQRGAEVAHLKAVGLGATSFGVANLVSSASSPELSLPARSRLRSLELIVNARVAIDPAVLEELVRRLLPGLCAAAGARAAIRTLQSFRPGRPQPTHRYAVAR